MPKCYPVENYICWLLMFFCNFLYKSLIFRAFYGLFTTLKGYGPPCVLDDNFILFWESDPRTHLIGSNYSLLAQVDHPCQWPQFTVCNSLNLGSALEHDQADNWNSSTRFPRPWREGDTLQPEFRGKQMIQGKAFCCPAEYRPCVSKLDFAK